MNAIRVNDKGFIAEDNRMDNYDRWRVDILPKTQKELAVILFELWANSFGAPSWAFDVAITWTIQDPLTKKIHDFLEKI